MFDAKGGNQGLFSLKVPVGSFGVLELQGFPLGCFSCEILRFRLCGLLRLRPALAAWRPLAWKATVATNVVAIRGSCGAFAALRFSLTRASILAKSALHKGLPADTGKHSITFVFCHTCRVNV